MKKFCWSGRRGCWRPRWSWRRPDVTMAAARRRRRARRRRPRPDRKRRAGTTTAVGGAKNTAFRRRCVVSAVPRSPPSARMKGDWCKAHDRPESQCFICHPELKEKFAAPYRAKYSKEPPAGRGRRQGQRRTARSDFTPQSRAGERAFPRGSSGVIQESLRMARARWLGQGPIVLASRSS